jgi:hypothetical protein
LFDLEDGGSSEVKAGSRYIVGKGVFELEDLPAPVLPTPVAKPTLTLTPRGVVTLKPKSGPSVKLPAEGKTLEEARAARGPVQWPEWPEPVATIYRIACRDGSVSDQYIGQTIHFDRRRWDHFLGRDSKLYDFIRDHGGWPNWKMSVVRQYPSCRDKNELDRLEWHWWNTLGGSLNSVRPGTHTHLWRGSDQEFEASVHKGLPTETFFKTLRVINL